jgi:hypothetical protein
MKNIILSSIAALAILLAAPQARAEEEQDWYTWYEQQNAQTNEQAETEQPEGEGEYAQYYDETSPDQYQDNYDGETPVQDGENVEADESGAIGGDGHEDETWEEAPQPEGGQTSGEEDWIWGENPPDQDQGETPAE